MPSLRWQAMACTERRVCAAVPVLSTGTLSVQNAYETQTPCTGSGCACPATIGFAQNSTVYTCYTVASSAMPAQLTLQAKPCPHPCSAALRAKQD